LALTLDPALALLAAAFGFSEEEELDEESLELEACLFLATFLMSAFLSLFLESSMDCFLDGASDDEAETFFYRQKIVSKNTL
jgi:hypothetical protein